MNKDQFKGRAKEVTGKVKKTVGRTIGDRKLESKGATEEFKGKVQKGVGNVKEKIDKNFRNA